MIIQDALEASESGGVKRFPDDARAYVNSLGVLMWRVTKNPVDLTNVLSGLWYPYMPKIDCKACKTKHTCGKERE